MVLGMAVPNLDYSQVRFPVKKSCSGSVYLTYTLTANYVEVIERPDQESEAEAAPPPPPTPVSIPNRSFVWI